MAIENYNSSMAQEITDLYYKSVHETTGEYYTQEQRDAWAPYPIAYEEWKARLDESKPCVFVEDSKVVGFVELRPNGHIDCFFVHPKYQGKGIASALYQHLEEQAVAQNMTALDVEASYLIRPLFLNRGFVEKRRNVALRFGVELVNFIMVKTLEN